MREGEGYYKAVNRAGATCCASLLCLLGVASLSLSLLL